MKKLLLIVIISLMFTGKTEAYETLANFNALQNGRFVLFVNGKKVNYRPAQQISVNHLYAGRNDLRIRFFNNGASCDINETIFLKRGHETSYNIKTDRYGNLRLIKTGVFQLFENHSKPVFRENRNSQFKNFIIELERRRFDDKKFNFASNYINRNDLSVRQLTRIIKQFSFEDTKVDFILNAYDHVYDKENFYLIYDELRFRSSVRTIKNKLGLIRKHRKYSL